MWCFPFPDDSMMNDDDRAAQASTAGTAGGETQQEADTRANEEAIRRQMARLQDRLNGNRLDPAPTPRTPPARDDHRKKSRRRMSTVDLEDVQYRTDRRDRERDRMNRRGSRARSESPEREAPMSPWSAIGEIGRPRNYTRAQVNRIGVGAALELKNWEREADRQRELQLAKPGTRHEGAVWRPNWGVAPRPSERETE